VQRTRRRRRRASQTIPSSAICRKERGGQIATPAPARRTRQAQPFSSGKETYTVGIQYELGLRPKINILAPVLTLAAGRNRLPHVYADGQHDICVNRPEDCKRGMFIADTIMPWLSQWLYFYEIWAMTGKWFGKGTHPLAPQHSEV
jgi:hypothetical protein